MDETENNAENKTMYLYGASVQGIQEFIFQTNKLKEIVGASELVEQICTTAFDCYAKNGESIVRAAGNIKHIFFNRKDCEEAALNFPREVMTMAPGITISQAVVTLKRDESDYAAQSNELEKLLQTQRNKAPRSMTLGLMSISRSPSSGLPAVSERKNELIDAASEQKIKLHQATKKLAEKSFGKVNLNYSQIAYNIENITDKNNWIAVIHADGNGMGNIFQEVGKYKNDMKLISPAVSHITESAAQKAFETVEKKYLSNSSIIPIRPIILGGDDLTLICRADFALEYIKTFLELFETASQEIKNLKLEKESSWEVVKKGFTACAGIAFVKSSYPFHYAIHLAESLCGEAKKKAKEVDEKLAPSCIMFHKVQDSFVEDYIEIINRELTPQNTKLSFVNGPYYCGDYAKLYKEQCNVTVEQLLDRVYELAGEKENKMSQKEGNAIKSHLRQWLGLLSENIEAANQKMKRLRTINDKAKEFIYDAGIEELKADIEKKIPYYDILSLSSILFADTKKGGKEQ